jgi:PmbA protein
MFHREVLEKAALKADAAQVFLRSSGNTPVRFAANKLKTLETRDARSLTLRVIHAGRVGIASTSKFEDADWVVEAALAAAEFGPEARFEFADPAANPEVDVFDPRTPAHAVEDMVEVGREIVDLLRQHEPDLNIDVGLDKEVERTAIAGGAGELAYERTSYGGSVSANLVRGSDVLDVYSFQVECGPDFDLDRIYAEITEKLDLAKESATVATGTLPVVLTPMAFGMTLAPALGAGFNGKLIEQGASPLVGRIGEQVFDERLAIADDATLHRSPLSCPFDDEGVPTRRVPLIEDGVVKSFLFDLQTAGRLGETSTGNGYGATPAPRVSATVVGGGEGSLEDLIGDIEEGILADYLLGGGQANVLRGDFGGNLLLGFKIEQGQLVGRLKDTLISGNAYELLAKIGRIGGRCEWVGGRLCAPPLMLEGVTVATRG